MSGSASIGGRAGFGEGRRRRRSGSGSWGRIAAGAAAAFFAVLAVTGMGSTLVGPASGACAPAEAEGGSVRGVPRQYVPTYRGGAERFGLGARGPAILAAIHKVETDFGRSPLPGVRSGENFAGAGGPMQFLDPTWDAYGVDGDGDGRKDRYDSDDAIFGAANYLSASGAPRDWYRAIFAYNHADWYVRDVLGWAKRFGDIGSMAEVRCVPEAAAADLGRAVRLYEPREFRTLPRGLMAAGYAPQPIDARLYDNAVWILRTYEFRFTGARESGHATHGDGTALDMVPAGEIGSQAVWDRSAGRLAGDLGWRRSCAASGSKPVCPLVPAIQFGYDGYPSHGSPRTCGGGCTAHIHVSWASSSFGSGPLSPPARWVMAFPAPGARAWSGRAGSARGSLRSFPPAVAWTSCFAFVSRRRREVACSQFHDARYGGERRRKMNSVALVGRLTKDPELGHIESQDGRAVCDLRIAVSNGPEKPPTYVDVACFDRQAEACAAHLSKGRQVAVDGRLLYREWEAEDGSRRSKHSVVGRVEFLGSANGSRSAEEEGSDEVDIPF